MSDKLDKLLQKQARISKAVQLEKSRVKKQERADDTRRKVLAGAYALHRAAQNPAENERLLRELDGFLDKPKDRALFGLPPKGEQLNQPAPPAPEVPPTPPYQQ